MPAGVYTLSIPGIFQDNQKGDLNITQRGTQIRALNPAALPAIEAQGLGDRVFRIETGATAKISGLIIRYGEGMVGPAGGGFGLVATSTIPGR